MSHDAAPRMLYPEAPSLEEFLASPPPVAPAPACEADTGVRRTDILAAMNPTGKGVARPAIVVPLSGGDLQEIRNIYTSWLADPKLSAQLEAAQLIEWRVDGFCGRAVEYAYAKTPIDLSFISKPLVATWRSADQGGSYALSEDDYTTVVSWLAAQDGIEYVDVETVRRDAARCMQRIHEGGMLAVASYHNFDETPDEQALLEEMVRQDAMGADVVKIAVTPHCDRDVISLLAGLMRFTQWKATPAIGIAMGERGEVTRLMGHRFGSVATFATIGGRASAPGQLSVAEVVNALDTLQRR